MATLTDGADLAASSTHAGSTAASSETRFAWQAVALATWLTLGVALVSWALETGAATDAGFSPYHVPGYLALLALAAWCVILVGRAMRAGGSWRTAFPTGYGVLGAGLLALLAYVIMDVGWREGVGIGPGLEGSLAPSRVLLVIGMAPRHRAARGPRSSRRTGSVAAGRRSCPPRSPWASCSTAASIPRSTRGWRRPLRAPLDDAEVWVMAPDGTAQTRLIEATDGDEGSGATWSPDGQRIAFTRWRSGPDEPYEADIWVANADGADAHALVEGPGWHDPALVARRRLDRLHLRGCRWARHGRGSAATGAGTGSARAGVRARADHGPRLRRRVAEPGPMGRASRSA